MLSIGLFGASGIAPAAIIDPVRRRTGDVVVQAVASRSPGAAAAYAQRFGIPTAYSSYESLLEDPALDLLYNALPPSEHARWTIRALEAGKHVLVEKPFTLDAAEAHAVYAAADRAGRRVFEAHHDLYHPLQAEIRRSISSGRLGTLVSLRAAFLVTNIFDPKAFRHDPSLGGGALMDLGTYALQWLRSAAGSEPEVIGAEAVVNPLGADSAITADLRFAGDVPARMEASMEHQGFEAVLEVTGSAGTLRAEGVVLPHLGHRVIEIVDGVTSTRTVAGRESYDHQLEAVVAGLASGDRLPTEREDPIAMMDLIDTISSAAGLRRHLP